MNNFKSLIYLVLCIGSLCVISSCGGDDLPEDQQLMEFFEKNNITPQMTASGLFYVIDEPGSNEKPTAQTAVTVHYRGYFLDGDEFDSSYNRGEPSTFGLNQVIAGWTEGLQLFGRGGQGSLYLPSNLAYGSRGNSSIPGFTPIAFDIELINF